MPNLHQLTAPVVDEIPNKFGDVVIQPYETALEEDPDDPLYMRFTKAVLQDKLKRKVSERQFEEMSPAEIISARMTKASYINLKEGAHAAQKYTNENIHGYKLDHSLSNEHQAVFHNPTTGDLRVAYRGTQAGRDWATNIRMAAGRTEDAQQVKELIKSMDAVIKKYGKKPDVISGHSKGGGQAIFMGERYGIETHTQDPYVPKDVYLKTKSLNARHFITRTPTDWVSLHAPTFAFREGVQVDYINPKKGTGILKSHDLNLMTGVDYKSRGNTDYNPDLKDKAYIAEQIIDHSKDLQSIAEDLNYKEGSQEYRNLERQFEELTSKPQEHTNLLTEAGYFRVSDNTIGGQAKQIATRVASEAVERGTAKVGEAVSNTFTRETGKQLIGGIILGKAFEAAGVEPQTLGITNEHVQDLVAGGELGAIGEASIQGVNEVVNQTRSLVAGQGLRPSAINFKNIRGAAVGGAIGALTEGVVSNTLESALERVGVDAPTAYATSHIAGGILGGAASIASVPVAGLVAGKGLMKAEQVLGRKGMELVGRKLGALGARLAGREALTTSIGSSVPVVGTAVGAVVGGVIDAIDVAFTLPSLFEREKPKAPVLLPHWNREQDQRIANNPEIQRLLSEFDTSNVNPDTVADLTARIQTEVDSMDLPEGYNFQVNLGFVEMDGSGDIPTMAEGDYSQSRLGEVNLEEYIENERRRQRETAIAAERFEIGTDMLNFISEQGLDTTKLLGAGDIPRAYERAQKIKQLRDNGIEVPDNLLNEGSLTAFVRNIAREQGGEQDLYTEENYQRIKNREQLRSDLQKISNAGLEAPTEEDVILGRANISHLLQVANQRIDPNNNTNVIPAQIRQPQRRQPELSAVDSEPTAEPTAEPKTLEKTETPQTETAAA